MEWTLFTYTDDYTIHCIVAYSLVDRTAISAQFAVYINFFLSHLRQMMNSIKNNTEKSTKKALGLYLNTINASERWLRRRGVAAANGPQLNACCTRISHTN